MTMKKTIFFSILGLAVVACGTENKELTDAVQDTHQDTKKKTENKQEPEEIESFLSNYSSLPLTADTKMNTYSPEKLDLGQHLFFDTRLSLKGNNSCNSCHNLSTYGVDNEPTSLGDAGKRGGRNSPTVLNAALHSSQFWDGRAKDVEEQAGMPILNPIEMAIPDEEFLIKRLSEIPAYVEAFKAAFPDDEDPLNYTNLRKAIGVFERRLLTPSRFDKFLEGDKDALTAEEKKGFITFNKVGCVACHSGVLLGGDKLQKFGLVKDYWELTHSEKIDEGRFLVTENEADKFIFKVPSLRNIEKTSPYFHDGSVKSLEDAVQVMAMAQLGKTLSDDEVKEITTFLKSLTGTVPEKYKEAPIAY